MKLMITENQVKELIDILLEDDSVPSFMRDIPIPKSLQTLANIAGGKGVNDILAKATPEQKKDFLKFFGGDQPLKANSKANPTTNTPSTISNSQGTNLIHPLGNKKLTAISRFNAPRGSRTHKGLDISAPSGTPVYAPADGSVISARDTTPNACGGFIKINHGNVITKFCHLRSWVVKPGQEVKQGEIIGYTGGGSTDPYKGRSTGPHLHYEILNNSGIAMNPQQVQFGLA